MKRTIFITVLLGFFLAACKPGSNRLAIDVSGIPDPGVTIERYGRDLFHIDPSNIASELPSLAEKYPVFIDPLSLDTLVYIQIHDFITDPFLREIARETEKQFPDTRSLEAELNMAFRYFKHYYPAAIQPVVYSYISGLDFEYPVQIQDSIILIALDMYLGKDFEPYAMSRIPQYRTRRATAEHISRDVMMEIANTLPLSYRPENILLDQMIEKGKALYFLDAMLPLAHDTIKIGYSNQQLQWCEANEPNLWAFIIENELLFSSDYEKTHKLIIDGPFTSFFPEGSPARTGWWVGWQIVRQFMEQNPGVSLSQLMDELTPRQVLDNSGYNP